MGRLPCWCKQIGEHLTIAGKFEDVDIALCLLGICSRGYFTPEQKDIHLEKFQKQPNCSLSIEMEHSVIFKMDEMDSRVLTHKTTKTMKIICTT